MTQTRFGRPAKFFLLLAAMAAPLPSFADSPLPTRQADGESRTGPSPEWSGRLGLGAGVAPEFQGSDDYRFVFAPSARVEWRGMVFLDTRQGLGVNVIRTPHFNAGVALTYSRGRDADDIEPAGLGDIDGGVGGRLFGSSHFGGWRLAASASHQFTGDDTGVQGNASLSYRIKATRQWTVTPAANISWASDDYMDAYFGVTPAQSAASGLSTFDADGGVKSVGVSLGTNYRINESWSVHGNVGLNRLVGSASDSPITKKPKQANAMVGVGFRF